MRNDHHQDEDWGGRGRFALRLATVMTVLAVIALGTTGARNQDETATTSTPTATAGTDKPYYFPSEYELKAPVQEGESAPTF